MSFRLGIGIDTTNFINDAPPYKNDLIFYLYKILNNGWLSKYEYGSTIYNGLIDSFSCITFGAEGRVLVDGTYEALGDYTVACDCENGSNIVDSQYCFSAYDGTVLCQGRFRVINNRVLMERDNMPTLGIDIAGYASKFMFACFSHRESDGYNVLVVKDKDGNIIGSDNCIETLPSRKRSATISFGNIYTGTGSVDRHYLGNLHSVYYSNTEFIDCSTTACKNSLELAEAIGKDDAGTLLYQFTDIVEFGTSINGRSFYNLATADIEAVASGLVLVSEQSVIPSRQYLDGYSLYVKDGDTQPYFVPQIQIAPNFFTKAFKPEKTIAGYTYSQDVPKSTSNSINGASMYINFNTTGLTPTELDVLDKSNTLIWDGKDALGEEIRDKNFYTSNPLLPYRYHVTELNLNYLRKYLNPTYWYRFYFTVKKDVLNLTNINVKKPLLYDRSLTTAEDTKVLNWLKTNNEDNYNKYVAIDVTSRKKIIVDGLPLMVSYS